MNNQLKFVSLSIFMIMIIFLIGCGPEPPNEDLEKAKASIAKSEEVEAGKYAPKEFDEAKQYYDVGAKTVVQGKSARNTTAKKYLGVAIIKADTAFQISAPQYATKYIKEAEESLSKAKEIKADVATKSEFDQANTLLNDSKDSLNKKKYETSWTKAKESKTIADNAYKTATEKKVKSEDAIKEAEEKMKELEK